MLKGKMYVEVLPPYRRQWYFDYVCIWAHCATNCVCEVQCGAFNWEGYANHTINNFFEIKCRLRMWLWRGLKAEARIKTSAQSSCGLDSTGLCLGFKFMAARPATPPSKASRCLNAAHSEAHCCYQIKARLSVTLVSNPQMEVHPKQALCTLTCDLDSWPRSLNLTGSRPWGRWNMEDIRWALTPAFSTSDLYMHSHLTLTDDEHILNNEKMPQHFPI